MHFSLIIFQVASGGEYVTMQSLGHAVGDARFQNHWNTFITEQDIANIGTCGQY